MTGAGASTGLAGQAGGVGLACLTWAGGKLGGGREKSPRLTGTEFAFPLYIDG